MEQSRARQGIVITPYVNLRTLGMDTQPVGGHWLEVLLLVHLALPELHVAGRVGAEGPPEGQHSTSAFPKAAHWKDSSPGRQWNNYAGLRPGASRKNKRVHSVQQWML